MYLFRTILQVYKNIAKSFFKNIDTFKAEKPKTVGRTGSIKRTGSSAGDITRTGSVRRKPTDNTSSTRTKQQSGWLSYKTAH